MCVCVRERERERLSGCVSHILNQLSVDGHLGYFHVLAIVNSSAMECIYLFELEFSSFLDIGPGVEFLDHRAATFLVF